MWGGGLTWDEMYRPGCDHRFRFVIFRRIRAICGFFTKCGGHAAIEWRDPGRGEAPAGGDTRWMRTDGDRLSSREQPRVGEPISSEKRAAGRVREGGGGVVLVHIGEDRRVEEKVVGETSGRGEKSRAVSREQPRSKPRPGGKLPARHQQAPFAPTSSKLSASESERVLAGLMMSQPATASSLIDSRALPGVGSSSAAPRAGAGPPHNRNRSRPYQERMIGVPPPYDEVATGDVHLVPVRVFPPSQRDASGAAQGPSSTRSQASRTNLIPLQTALVDPPPLRTPPEQPVAFAEGEDPRAAGELPPSTIGQKAAPVAFKFTEAAVLEVFARTKQPSVPSNANNEQRLSTIVEGSREEFSVSAPLPDAPRPTSSVRRSDRDPASSGRRPDDEFIGPPSTHLSGVSSIKRMQREYYDWEQNFGGTPENSEASSEQRGRLISFEEGSGPEKDPGGEAEHRLGSSDPPAPHDRRSSGPRRPPSANNILMRSMIAEGVRRARLDRAAQHDPPPPRSRSPKRGPRVGDAGAEKERPPWSERIEEERRPEDEEKSEDEENVAPEGKSEDEENVGLPTARAEPVPAALAVGRPTCVGVVDEMSPAEDHDSAPQDVVDRRPAPAGAVPPPADPLTPPYNGPASSLDAGPLSEGADGLAGASPQLDGLAGAWSPRPELDGLPGLRFDAAVGWVDADDSSPQTARGPPDGARPPDGASADDVPEQALFPLEQAEGGKAQDPAESSRKNAEQTASERIRNKLRKKLGETAPDNLDREFMEKLVSVYEGETDDGYLDYLIEKNENEHDPGTLFLQKSRIKNAQYIMSQVQQ